MTDQRQVAYVRTEMLPEQAPPSSQQGVFKWVRENLFPDVVNSIMTVLALLIIYYLLSGFMPWLFGGVWTADSIRDCRDILDAAGRETGGCFAVLTERWNQMLFGFTYPTDQYWRPFTAFLLLPFAVTGLMFMGLIAKAFRILAIVQLCMAALIVLGAMAQGSGLGMAVTPAILAVLAFVISTLAASGTPILRYLILMTALYPFVAFWLIWGGSILSPLFVMIGLIIGYLVFKRGEAFGFAAGVALGLVATVIVWIIGGQIAGLAPDFLAFEAVRSRDMGGFMLNFILGTVCVSLSLPIGIVLALGRQSDMPIIKIICVVFIEFVRGVPLITLLFVANVVLSYFLPPETKLDLILRVIVMITLFSSAYIAEVIRGGLAALPTGQYEAADSLGLDYAQATRLIILPQALKISIPGIVNVSVGLFKDTTLVSVISMFDLVGMIRGPILASTEWNGVYWELWGAAILLFFPVCYGISQYSQWLERQLDTSHR